MNAKLSELWNDVEGCLSEKTPSGARFAIIEAYKVLKVVLDSKGYPGKKIETQLFWAGYSLKDKEGISEVISKRGEILNKFEYNLSDLEAEEIVRHVKHVINEILKRGDFTLKDKTKVFAENYLSAKSLLFWRNLALLMGIFVLIKILNYTEFGKSATSAVVGISDFIVSWFFLFIVTIIMILAYFINNYFESKPKVKIKEEN